MTSLSSSEDEQQGSTVASALKSDQEQYSGTGERLHYLLSWRSIKMGEQLLLFVD